MLEESHSGEEVFVFKYSLTTRFLKFFQSFENFAHA